jgi:hypothetical protein
VPRRDQRVDQRQHVLRDGQIAQVLRLGLLAGDAQVAQLGLQLAQRLALAAQHHDLARGRAGRHLRGDPARGLARLQRALVLLGSTRGVARLSRQASGSSSGSRRAQGAG